MWGSCILAWKCYMSHFVLQGCFLDFLTTNYPCSSVEALHLVVRLIITYRWNMDRRYKTKMVFSPPNHLSSSHEFFGQTKSRWTCRMPVINTSSLCVSGMWKISAVFTLMCHKIILCVQWNTSAQLSNKDGVLMNISIACSNSDSKFVNIIVNAFLLMWGFYSSSLKSLSDW